MNVLLLALGTLLLVLVVVDLFWTTFWVDGGSGPVSSRLTTGLWRGLKRVGGRRSRTLSLAGPLILSMTLFTWVAFIWAGWTLLFAGGQDTLTDTIDNEPVTWAGRFFFVGYSMFTMGNGDYTPKDGFWEIAAALTTATGMLFVTLAVSYVLSVLGAMAQKRSFANGVTGIGRCSEAFVQSGWNGHDLHALDLPLSALATQLGTLTEQHKSYPILHYYHSEKSEDASAMAVAILDEALTLLLCAVPETHRPNPAVLKNARSSCATYLETLHTAFIQPADHSPPPPDLARLRAAGIPTVADEEFAETLAGLEQRRRKLLGMIQADAWHWPPVKS